MCYCCFIHDLLLLSLSVQSHKEIQKMEEEMNALNKSAGLFEVNMPDYKQLKACRKYVHVYIYMHAVTNDECV